MTMAGLRHIDVIVSNAGYGLFGTAEELPDCPTGGARRFNWNPLSMSVVARERSFTKAAVLALLVVDSSFKRQMRSVVDSSEGRVSGRTMDWLLFAGPVHRESHAPVQIRKFP